MENQKGKQIHALVQLLDDSDEQIISTLKDQLHDMGEEVIPFLEGEWEQTNDEHVRETIEHVIHEIQFNRVIHDLHAWNVAAEEDLLEAYLILSRYLYPDVDVIKLKAGVERIARDIWIELNDNLTGLEKVKVINHILYDIHKFKVSDKEDHPSYFYLNNLLETKTGNEFSMALLYLITCQINQMDVFGVDLPGHLILALTYTPFDIEEPLARTSKVLFYLNPAQRGTVFTRQEIELYIKELQIESHESYYTPCSERQVLTRFVDELISSYAREGIPDKVDELQQMRNLLDSYQ